MPSKKGTTPWVPLPIHWDAAQLSDDGRRLRLVYLLQPADRADVRWEPLRITVTLSRMGAPGGSQKLPLARRCVELALSRDATGLILIDGASGERATAKRPTYLDPDELRRSEMTLEQVWKPSEFLTPREVEGGR